MRNEQQTQKVVIREGDVYNTDYRIVAITDNIKFDGMITTDESSKVWWETRALKKNSQGNKRPCIIGRAIFFGC